MTEINTEKEELIAEIIRRTLDDLANWEPAKLMPGVGPQYPEIHQTFARKRTRYCDKVRELLRGMSVDRLRSEFLKGTGSASNPLVQRHGIYFDYVKELDQLNKFRPAWFAGGWSVEGLRLDPTYWGAATTVSVKEAALMIVGVEPRKVEYDTFFEAYGEDDRTDEVLYFLEDIFELLVRKFGDPDEADIEIPLADLCAWVEQYDVVVSFVLRDIFRRRSTDSAHKRSEAEAGKPNKPLHARTRQMFQRALLVVAVEGYGLRERKDAAGIARKMVEAGDFVGFSLDAKKLASHIRAGLMQVDPEGGAAIRDWQSKK